MQEAKKKALVVKIKAVGRTIKEYKSYKQEVEKFDMTLVAQDKKQAEFYKETTSAFESAKKNMI
jgi:Sec-independent protein translocase protein TatA